MKPSLLIPLTCAAFSLTFVSCETYDYDYDDIDPVVYDPGYEVDSLPDRYAIVTIDDSPYYYSCGNYYTLRGDRYTVVDPPLRSSTRSTYTYGEYYDTLPDSYQTVRYRNRDYYYDDGQFFRSFGNRHRTVRSPYYRL